LKPDYASIYVGINDTGYEIAFKCGVDTEKFEKIYTMMIDEIKEACPQTKLIIITPFFLEGKNTCNTEQCPDRLERFKMDVPTKVAAAKRVAGKYNLPVIELQPVFDQLLKKAPADYWTQDGVHPTACGHEMIKRLWLEVFDKIK
jgi:lysophospholipase L1-like esterase